MQFSREHAVKFMAEKMASFGAAKEDAEITAEVLVEAELREDPSHGVSCLISILKSIKKGDIMPSKKPAVIMEKNATAVIDGENILGPVSASHALDIAMRKAKEHGIAAVSIRKSHHLFTLGYYTKIAAQNNFIGILTTSTAPAMAFPGTLEKILGTNPFSIGIPSENVPIILDMSSSQVARGKIKEAAKKGAKIPSNWAVDKYGKPTDDPEKALEGSLQPMGGHKGFALALVIDILSGILSESASGKEIFGTSMHANDENKKTAYKGDLLIAIDISKFTDVNAFKARVARLTGEIKNSQTIDGSKIYIPGEKAYLNRNELIEIDDKLYEEITIF